MNTKNGRNPDFISMEDLNHILDGTDRNACSPAEYEFVHNEVYVKDSCRRHLTFAEISQRYCYDKHDLIWNVSPEDVASVDLVKAALSYITDDAKMESDARKYLEEKGYNVKDVWVRPAFVMMFNDYNSKAHREEEARRDFRYAHEKLDGLTESELSARYDGCIAYTLYNACTMGFQYNGESQMFGFTISRYHKVDDLEKWRIMDDMDRIEECAFDLEHVGLLLAEDLDLDWNGHRMALGVYKPSYMDKGYTKTIEIPMPDAIRGGLLVEYIDGDDDKRYTIDCDYWLSNEKKEVEDARKILEDNFPKLSPAYRESYYGIVDALLDMVTVNKRDDKGDDEE